MVLFVFFCFFRQLLLCFLRGAGISVLRDPTLSATTTKTKPYSKSLGKGTLNTCTKFQGVTLKSGVDTWTLFRVISKIPAWRRNHLVLVYV